MKLRVTTRGFWLMLALAGLFSVFTASSTNTLRFNHLPGRMCARAGGTARSMSQRDQVEKAAAQPEDTERTLSSDLDAVHLAAPVLLVHEVRSMERPRPVSTMLWPPLHLFRPPPFLSVA